MNIIIGLLSGAAASMGFGGGFVLIIYLTVFLNIDQITAQGVNLLFFLPVALVSIIIHQKNRLIKWKLLLKLIPGGILGILLGTLVASAINVDFLQKIFAGLLVLVGFRELFHKKK
ncbi:MAG: sulfite exporter TauE/SafE family protein [Ruminiclostridium sp.]|nr:sulfite exporter TauE/SafE family protein [Ruminiclostridium sp.]